MKTFLPIWKKLTSAGRLHRANQKVYLLWQKHQFTMSVPEHWAMEIPRKVYLNFRNGLALIYKHFTDVEMLYKLPLRLCLDWVAAFTFLLKGQTGELHAQYSRRMLHS